MPWRKLRYWRDQDGDDAKTWVLAVLLGVCSVVGLFLVFQDELFVDDKPIPISVEEWHTQQ